MSIELWISFVAATALLSLMPGPCVLLLIAQSLARGFKPAFMSLIGILAADILLISLSLLGVGAILATSVLMFQVVKWAGVSYMLYLGYEQIRDGRKQCVGQENAAESQVMKGSFRAGFLASFLNPKAILFYVAFLSQFIDPLADTIVQNMILVVTNTIVIAVVLGAYILLATRARKAFQSYSARKKLNFVSGGFFLGGGLLLSLARN